MATTSRTTTPTPGPVSPPRVKVQHLSILMLKEGYGSTRDALKCPDDLHQYSLDGRVLPHGSLYIGRSRPRAPHWLDFIRPGIEGALAPITGVSVSAVLFVESSGRRFALTFGYGRNLLKPEAIEHDFGLKVVLNRVDPENLRSIDVKSYEELTIHTRRQASRGSTFHAFGFNVAQDMVRSVTGNPKDTAFARRLAGSDGLAIALPIELRAIPDKCKDLLDAYRDDSYKKSFEFIDHLRSIRDPSLKRDLNKELERLLARKDTTGMHLAPPEPIDWEDVDGFTYDTESHEATHAELDIAEYVSTTEGLTVEALRKQRIGVMIRSTEHSVKKWTAFQALTCELMLHDKLFVLSGGEWFVVAQTFAERVRGRVAEVASTTVKLPHSTAGEHEQQYNERVANMLGHALVDRKLINSFGTGVEPCDMFTASRQFIHVKRANKSAPLSHLFAQGVVAAEAFVSDDTFRRETHKLLESIDRRFAKLVPTSTRPIPANFEIVYAIATKADPRWPASLPFFSQLNLVNAADRLARLGFRVCLTRIDVR